MHIVNKRWQAQFKNLVSQVCSLQSIRRARDARRKEGRCAYVFILEGIEYATESEAREALAEMQA